MSRQRQGQSAPRKSFSVAESRQPWQDDVAARAAVDAGGLDTALLGGFLDLLADPDRPFDRDAQAAFVALGARAAQAGVPLRALVDLYLSAAWRAWPVLPAAAGTDPDAVRAAGSSVLRASDDAVAALAEGFAAAGRSVLRREESLRREFVDDLLSGSADPTALLGRAESYGLQLAGPHAVLVGRSGEPFRDGTGRLADVAAAVSGDDRLVTTRDGDLVAVLPAAAADAATDAAARALARSGTRWALGRPYPGGAGVARSFTEARESLELADRLGDAAEVVRADQLVVHRVLLRDRAALLDLVETVLTPLRTSRGGAEPLLATVEAYAAAGGNTTRAADRLHLSVRAVTYRLRRVAALTGWDPADPEQRYVLQTAVVGARALDWN